jgi:hypothetical protein
MTVRREQFQELTETQTRGQATEAILKSEFVLRDIPVLVPEYDNEPYDIVVELDGFQRIQCKTAYRNKDGTVQFETLRTRPRSDGYERDGHEGEIDHFAVYNLVCDECYLVPIDSAATGKMEIRFQQPANNQRNGINWHDDFLLDTVLSSP